LLASTRQPTPFGSISGELAAQPEGLAMTVPDESFHTPSIALLLASTQQPTPFDSISGELAAQPEGIAMTVPYPDESFHTPPTASLLALLFRVQH